MDRYGRFANDEPHCTANAVMKKMTLDGVIHMCLFAKCSIAAHEEIVYDYGDKKNRMPWRQYAVVLSFHLMCMIA